MWINRRVFHTLSTAFPKPRKVRISRNFGLWPLFHAAHSPYGHYNDILLFQYYRLKEAEKNAL